MMEPDALSAIAHKINNEWGFEGYGVASVVEGPLRGSAIAEVWHDDGSVFYVASDRYGLTAHGDSLPLAAAALRVATGTVIGASLNA